MDHYCLSVELCLFLPPSPLGLRACCHNLKVWRVLIPCCQKSTPKQTPLQLQAIPNQTKMIFNSKVLVALGSFLVVSSVPVVAGSRIDVEETTQRARRRIKGGNSSSSSRRRLSHKTGSKKDVSYSQFCLLFLDYLLCLHFLCHRQLFPCLTLCVIISNSV